MNTSPPTRFMWGSPRRGGWVAVLAMVMGAFLPTAEARVLRVGLYQNAPKVFTNEAGQAAGIFVDYLEAIAGAENWSLAYVDGTWGELLAMLERGDLDLMPDVAHSAERLERFSFNRETVLSDWFQIYARPDSGIHAIPDLADKRVLVLESSVQQVVFGHLLGQLAMDVTVLTRPGYGTMLHEVARGEADAAVVNRFNGAYLGHALGLADTAIIFHPTKLGFAAPLGRHAEVLDRIDAHLVAWKRDPASIYYTSLARWTTDEKPRPLMPPWARRGAWFALLVISGLLGGAWVVKRHTGAHTRTLAERNEQLTRGEQALRDHVATLERRLAESTRELDALKARPPAKDP